jgi:hypothetical protein
LNSQFKRFFLPQNIPPFCFIFTHQNVLRIFMAKLRIKTNINCLVNSTEPHSIAPLKGHNISQHAGWHSDIHNLDIHT